MTDKTTATAAAEKKSLLDAVTTRTKLIALTALVIEALFLVSVYALPETQRISAFYSRVVLLAIILLGIFWLEHNEGAALALAQKEKIATAEAAASIPQPPKYQMDSIRAKAIAGTWKGDGVQSVGPDGNPLPIKVTYNFQVDGAVITGDGGFRAVVDQSEVDVRFIFSGGFLYGQFLRFEFDRPDDHVVNFGSIILRLDDESTRLVGHYHGYGAKSKRIVEGTLDLTKIV